MDDADAILLIKAFMIVISKSRVKPDTIEKFRLACLDVIEELKSVIKSESSKDAVNQEV